MKTSAKSRNPMSRFASLLLVLVALIVAFANTGCVPAGYVMNQYGVWPDYSLYDPTNEIQSVIGYRQDAMDCSNDAWDEYIRE
jgi:hypothetical protein